MSVTPLTKGPKKERPGPKREAKPSAPEDDDPESTPVPGSKSVPAPHVMLPSDTEAAAKAAASLRAQRRRRARRLAIRALVGIGLPGVIASVYYLFVASSQYESVSLFQVQTAEAQHTLGLDTLIGGVTGGGAGRDTLAVRDYIQSRDMLNLLENEHGFRKHFSKASIDWVSRLPAQASLEDTYEYYEDVVRIEHDSSSGVLTLRVLGFDPEYSHELSTAILGYSEKMVNQLSERARLDQTKLAQQEVALAEKRLTKARQAIVELQQKHAEFSPEASASGAMALRTQLQGQLAEARAELMQAKAFMQPNAPRVIEAEARVQSLSAQVSEESRRLVNPTNEKGLSTTYAKFEAAMVEKEFAQSAYQSALTSLEMARVEASSQHRYLATISRPSVADEETHPRRLRMVFTAFLLSMMLFGIVSLMVATVREHARV